MAQHDRDHLPPLDAVHRCFELLQAGQEPQALAEWPPAVVAEARELLVSDRRLDASGTPAPPEPARASHALLGTVIDGFEVLEPLGEGASGQVFHARQLSPSRDVALKLLWPCSHAEAFEQRREAAMLAMLEHPGIARLYAVGVWHHGGTFRPWIAMELVKGARPLASSTTSGWTIAARVALVASIADALAHAHAKGIIHRDLKPANVLLCADGSARIIDFGLARRDGHGQDRSLALLGDRIVGSLASMAPECLLPGAVADARADIFALGTILYGLLAGRPMRDLDGRSIAQALQSIAEDRPQPLAGIDKALRGDLDRIVGKSIHPDASQRHASMAQFARDLRDHLAGRPVLIEQQGALERVQRSIRRHWRVWSAAAIVIVALAVAASVSARSASHAREQARLANLSAASSAVDATDQLALDRALSALGDDSSPEVQLLHRVASLRGHDMADGDWYAMARGPDGSWMVGSNAHASPNPDRASSLSRWNGTARAWTTPLPLATTNGLAVSDDGRWIACCHVTEGVSVVDAQSGRVHRSWPARPDEAGGVPCFLDDGSLAILTTHLQRWTVDGMALGAALDLGIGETRVARRMRDGHLVAAGHRGAVMVDAARGTVMQTLECPNARQSAAWASTDDSTILIAGWDRTVRRYRRGTDEPLWTGRIHHDNIWSIEGLLDDRAVSAGADGMLAIWDLATGTSTAMPGSPDMVWSLLASDHGLWIGSQGGLRLQPAATVDRWIGTASDRRRVAVAPGWTAWIGPEGSIKGRRRDGTPLPTTELRGAFVLIASWPRGNRLCALRDDGAIVCIDVTSGQSLWEDASLVSDGAAEVAGIPMLAMHDELGLLLVASRLHGCAAMRLADGTVAWTRVIGQQCAAVGSGPGGSVFAGGRDGLVARLDRDGAILSSTRSQRSRPASMACDATGSRLMVGGADGTLRVLEADSLAQRLAIRVSNAALDCMWIDEDGVWLIDRTGVLRCR